MQDEIWMRGWDDGHARFSTDLGKVLTASTGWIATQFRRSPTATTEAPANPNRRPPAPSC